MFRNGTGQDSDWLFRLYKATMKYHVETAYGWDEAFQRQGFRRELPAEEFMILLMDRKPVAAYLIRNHPDHIWLDMILVEPEFQGRGLGNLMMERIKQLGHDTNLPVKLTVLNTNTAAQWYQRLGFMLYETNLVSRNFHWWPQNSGSDVSESQ
ncbi:GNAT family N-acetyltransferase [Spongorhabdus nitratireducens]